jgi:dihydroorotase
MKIFVKSAEILSKSSQYYKQVANLLIEDGILLYIGIEEKPADVVIEAKDLKVSDGWFDMRCSLRDPGFEHKEDVYTGIAAAAEGGFTEIACLPNTNPGVNGKDVVEYIKSRQYNKLVNVHPMGYVSVDGKGNDLTEMIDMNKAGAVAFTDAEHAIWHSGLLVKALQYLQTFDGLLLQHAEDSNITKYGQMHEGIASTMLGLKGLPSIAEEVVIARDLELLKYTEGKIHFSRVSSAKSIELIRQAKKEGYKVSCDVVAHQIAFTDNDLHGFDTQLKVNPPFRSHEDNLAIIAGVNDGTIDVIVSDHCPHEVECKKLEFDLADFGITGLETAFSVFNSYSNGHVNLETIIEKITVAPRRLLNIKQPVLAVGEKVNITIFSPSTEWTYGEKKIKSRSQNSPFLGKKLTGKALALVNNGKMSIN